jgi:DNA-3-methyladenine glycosylase
MMERRKMTKIENLCNGPGKLTQAFGITKEHNNLSLVDGDDGVMQVHNNRPIPENDIVTTTRIGLAKGVGDDLELRFYINGNRFVSRR